MANNEVPNIFSQLVKSAGNSAAGGYPYQIKAADLDRNFVFATLEIDATLVEETSGQEGFIKRKFKIPAVPEDGTYVLGAISGSLEWIETEECP
jgi:hypothetical protein